MAIYRPSAVVQLQVRADDFRRSRELTQRLEQRPPEATQSLAYKPDATRVQLERELVRVNQAIKELVALRSDTPPNQFSVLMANLKTERDTIRGRLEGSGAQKPPLAVSGPAPDDLVAFPQIVPRSLKIFRNTIQEPDTCAIEIDFRDAPFDPRIVRAAFVTVALGIVSPDDFTRGMAGQKNQQTGLPLSVVNPSSAFGLNSPTTGFTGWVTDWQVNYDGSDSETLRLEALDMTELLRITRLRPGDGIDLSLPIRVGVQTLIDSYPGPFGIRVLMDKIGDDNGDGPVPGDSVPSVRKARGGKVARRARSGSEEMSLWEHITDTCGSISLLPSFFGNDLRLIRPQAFNIGVDAPRIMVYGRNVQSMSFTRKIGGHKAPTIEARCYSAKQGRAIWARYPVLDGNKAAGVKQKGPEGRPTRPTQTGSSGARTSDTVKVIQTQGYDDIESLQAFAENYWYAMSKQEIEGTIETTDIDSFSVGDADTGVSEPTLGGFGDLLRLQPGDALELLIASAVPEGSPAPDNDPGPASAQRIASMAVARRSAYLQELGYDRKTADLLANAYNDPGFPSVFRVKDVTYDFDAEDGLHTTIGFVNFVAVPDERKTTKAPVGPEVGAITRGRRTEAALRLANLNEARRTLTQQRADGLVTDVEYRRRVEALSIEEKRALRDFRAE